MFLAVVIGFSGLVVVMLLSLHRAWIGPMSAFAVLGVDFGDGGGERFFPAVRGKNPPG